MMQRRFLFMRAAALVPALALAASLLLAVPGQAAAATLNVCPSGCPYAQIGPALADAHDGDTIRVGAGTYAGGITVDVSVKLVGAGVGRTIIKGGGPVITIGTFKAATQPTVSIKALTVTGGVTHSSPMSEEWTGQPNVIALGGGIAIMPNADFTGGATVTISHSLVTRNRVGPTVGVPFGPPCPDGPCLFALAEGGGIDNWGDLTLVDSTVSNNTASGAASDAIGAGIAVTDTGSLTVKRSRIVGNRALASVPNGRFAEGGGIFSASMAELKISDSAVNRNTVSLTSTLPYFVEGGDPLDMNANGGGIHSVDGRVITIDHTTFDRNVAKVSDPNGEPYAFDAALHPGAGTLVLRNSSITNNRVIANVATTIDVGPSGSAIDVAGTSRISHTRITGNTTVVRSQAGLAQATGAVYSGFTGSQPIVISNSEISGNTSTAVSAHGIASVIGAGLTNDGRLLLRDDLIANNTGIARGPSGSAHGGGIWNGSIFNLPIELTLQGTSVTGNRLRGSDGITLQGGGLFTDFAVTLSHSRIARNKPNDCVGCDVQGLAGPGLRSAASSLRSGRALSH